MPIKVKNDETELIVRSVFTFLFPVSFTNSTDIMIFANIFADTEKQATLY